MRIERQWSVYVCLTNKLFTQFGVLNTHVSLRTNVGGFVCVWWLENLFRIFRSINTEKRHTL